MAWNYRLVEHADGSGVGLHKVSYNKVGEEVSMSAYPCGFFEHTAEKLRYQIMLARMDALWRPVFSEPPEWE